MRKQIPTPGTREATVNDEKFIKVYSQGGDRDAGPKSGCCGKRCKAVTSPNGSPEAGHAAMYMKTGTAAFFCI